MPINDVDLTGLSANARLDGKGGPEESLSHNPDGGPKVEGPEVTGPEVTGPDAAGPEDHGVAVVAEGVRDSANASTLVFKSAPDLGFPELENVDLSQEVYEAINGFPKTLDGLRYLNAMSFANYEDPLKARAAAVLYWARLNVDHLCDVEIQEQFKKPRSGDGIDFTYGIPEHNFKFYVYRDTRKQELCLAPDLMEFMAKLLDIYGNLDSEDQEKWSWIFMPLRLSAGRFSLMFDNHSGSESLKKGLSDSPSPSSREAAPAPENWREFLKYVEGVEGLKAYDLLLKGGSSTIPAYVDAVAEPTKHNKRLRKDYGLGDEDRLPEKLQEFFRYIDSEAGRGYQAAAILKKVIEARRREGGADPGVTLAKMGEQAPLGKETLGVLKDFLDWEVEEGKVVLKPSFAELAKVFFPDHPGVFDRIRAMGAKRNLEQHHLETSVTLVEAGPRESKPEKPTRPHRVVLCFNNYDPEDDMFLTNAEAEIAAMQELVEGRKNVLRPKNWQELVSMREQLAGATEVIIIGHGTDDNGGELHIGKNESVSYDKVTAFMQGVFGNKQRKPEVVIHTCYSRTLAEKLIGTGVARDVFAANARVSDDLAPYVTSALAYLVEEGAFGLEWSTEARVLYNMLIGAATKLGIGYDYYLGSCVFEPGEFRPNEKVFARARTTSGLEVRAEMRSFVAKGDFDLTKFLLLLAQAIEFRQDAINDPNKVTLRVDEQGRPCYTDRNGKVVVEEEVSPVDEGSGAAPSDEGSVSVPINAVALEGYGVASVGVASVGVSSPESGEGSAGDDFFSSVSASARPGEGWNWTEDEGGGGQPEDEPPEQGALAGLQALDDARKLGGDTVEEDTVEENTVGGGSAVNLLGLKPDSTLDDDE